MLTCRLIKEKKLWTCKKCEAFGLLAHSRRWQSITKTRRTREEAVDLIRQRKNLCWKTSGYKWSLERKSCFFIHIWGLITVMQVWIIRPNYLKQTYMTQSKTLNHQFKMSNNIADHISLHYLCLTNTEKSTIYILY